MSRLPTPLHAARQFAACAMCGPAKAMTAIQQETPAEFIEINLEALALGPRMALGSRGIQQSCSRLKTEQGAQQ